ncbi:MAG: hypothetical protein DRQ37_03145 [Gammaproteobacteria bacterium]|nr:MAG: hypothetical protein DRQ37_03145 [Gammaproteobacteria bacterium]
MITRHLRQLIIAAALMAGSWAPTVSAVQLTYEGEFRDDAGKFFQMSVQAVPVTPHIVLVSEVSPVRDAEDADGNRYCWYLIDTEAGLKAMVASRPIAVASSTVSISPGEVERSGRFLAMVFAEIRESGGIQALVANCASSGQLAWN